MRVDRSSKSLIIYDLDGTLVDSVEVVQLILNGLREELGLLPLKRVDFFPWISLGGEDLIKNSLELYEHKDVLHFLNMFRSRYFDLPTPQETIFDGVFDCLKYLRDHKYRLAICTNKPRRLAEKVLRETGLNIFFDFINAGGDLPSKKPSKENAQVCLDYFGATAQTALMVGDSSVDQQLAKAIGIPFVFYRHGYDDGISKDSIEYELKHHSDLIQFLDI